MVTRTTDRDLRNEFRLFRVCSEKGILTRGVREKNMDVPLEVPGCLDVMSLVFVVCHCRRDGSLMPYATSKPPHRYIAAKRGVGVGDGRGS
jgi:hypothetical protein